MGTLTVEQLIKKLETFKKDSPVILIDHSIDDELLSGYPLKEDDIDTVLLFRGDDEENEIEGVGIYFENKLNENPVNG